MGRRSNDSGRDENIDEESCMDCMTSVSSGEQHLSRDSDYLDGGQISRCDDAQGRDESINEEIGSSNGYEDADSSQCESSIFAFSKA